MREIVISGHVPSKKNQLKLTKSGRGYYDKDLRARLDEISAEVAQQWQSRDRAGNVVANAPLLHPALAVIFYVTTENSDRDNKWTTIQDALVSGGVMKDDCISLNNGYILIGKAVTTVDVAGARVFVEESGDFDRLYHKLNQMDLNDYSVVALARKAKPKKKRVTGIRRFLRA